MNRKTKKINYGWFWANLGQTWTKYEFKLANYVALVYILRAVNCDTCFDATVNIGYYFLFWGLQDRRRKGVYKWWVIFYLLVCWKTVKRNGGVGMEGWRKIGFFPFLEESVYRVLKTLVYSSFKFASKMGKKVFRENIFLQTKP